MPVEVNVAWGKYPVATFCVVRSRVVKENKMAKHHPDLIMCRKQPGVGKALFIL